MLFNPPGVEPLPNGGGGFARSPCDLCKTEPCNPVIGSDQKVYRNEHCARCAGVTAIASALDQSVCNEVSGVMEWLKKYWYIPAAILAIILLMRR